MERTGQHDASSHGEACRARIEALDLEPHPEGGYFRETWRSDRLLELDDYECPRNAGTSILFLLPSGERSSWHRVASDELWLWQGGDPLELTTRSGDGAPSSVVLGEDRLQSVVTGGDWQTARPLEGPHGYALVGCVVIPGFDFADFELAAPVMLREVVPDDRSTFFEFQRDEEAIRMAAFTSDDPHDRTAFEAHWDRILASDSVLVRTIVSDASVVGHVASFDRRDEREVTYWIGRQYWGRGIATAALESFLAEERTRPIFARVAADNAASVRVLEKCGFVRTATDRGFAAGRGEEIDEFVYRKDSGATASDST